MQGNSANLGREEEGRLIRAAQDWMHIETCKQQLAAAMRRQPTLRELAELMNTTPGSLGPRLEAACQAYNLIVSRNLKLVMSVVRKHNVQASFQEDLLSAGIEGLRLAIRKFDASKNTKLSTSAYWWIRQRVGRTAARDHLIPIPVNQGDLLSKMRSEPALLAAATEGELTPEVVAAMAAALGVSKERVRSALSGYRTSYIMSLDMPVGDGGNDKEMTMHETIESPHMDSAAHAEQVEVKAVVEELLKGLTDREAEVIRRRFELDGRKMLSLSALGARLGMGSERVRQVEVAALAKLRKNAAAMGLDEEALAALARSGDSGLEAKPPRNRNSRGLRKSG